MHENKMRRYVAAKVNVEVGNALPAMDEGFKEPSISTLYDVIEAMTSIGDDISSLKGFHLTASTDEAEVCRGLLFR